MKPRASDADPAGTLAAGLREYLSGVCDGTVEQVAALRRLAGGASHETWAFDLIANEGGIQSTTALILRRDFDQGLLDADLGHEFELFKYLHAHGAPVPRARWCVSADSPLATPFIIVERANGADIRKLLADPARAPARNTLGRALVATLAALHRTPIYAELERCLHSEQEPGAAREVTRWAAVIARGQDSSQPLLRAALAWLNAHLPAASPLALVHGDYKTNNLIFATDSAVVIDWEMAHLGDALEDLAWTMLWTTDYDLVGGLLSRQAYLDAYVAESGQTIDPRRLFFWEMFSLVKLAAIFLSGARQGTRVGHARPMLAMLGRALPWIEVRLATGLNTALRGPYAA